MLSWKNLFLIITAQLKQSLYFEQKMLSVGKIAVEITVIFKGDFSHSWFSCSKCEYYIYVIISNCCSDVALEGLSYLCFLFICFVFLPQRVEYPINKQTCFHRKQRVLHPLIKVWTSYWLENSYESMFQKEDFSEKKKIIMQVPLLTSEYCLFCMLEREDMATPICFFSSGTLLLQLG